ncbi:putative sulfate exporter family transporter [Desulfobulbus elongatus]|uniref:putative sulfate exporter family transporter n=1 Tax=Desulfobulbus elongatus TaxID=53332 RepID=UPI000686846E|nr:putative sulfate exporter family transporter [Desulfobulbus elongatus]
MSQENTHGKLEGGGGWISEDWLALILGLVIFALSLGSFKGMDILGWGAKMGVWVDPGKAVSAISSKYKGVEGEIAKIDGQKLTLKTKDGKEATVTADGDVSALQVGQQYKKAGMAPIVTVVLTYLFALVIMTLGAVALGANVPKFMFGFTLAFWLSYLCWFMGHWGYIAATKQQAAKFGIPWALSMSGEFGYILALILGLLIGNLFPGLANLMKEAARPELYIKTGIVIMGAGLGIKAAESFGLASNIMFRGFCAIVEAYLIYWAVVYYISRKYFKFSREWSAPLASGISICGVSASIATGGAIRARPIVPIMVSSLVVIFVAIEMVILPFLAKFFLWTEPLVAGAWMGLAVKSDGGAIASGAITDALIRAQALDAAGINYAEGWITMTATTVKMFIDIFIGVWAFLLAYIWVAKIDVKPGQKVDAGEIWHRFPKFVIGYVLTFAILVAMCWPAAKVLGPADKELAELKASVTSIETKMKATTDATVLAGLKTELDGVKAKQKEVGEKIKEPKSFLGKAKSSSSQGDVFRGLFFLLCFFTIGLVSNFKKLMQEGLGKLAAVYCISLFGFIIWVGLFISWLFFHGVKPPTI